MKPLTLLLSIAGVVLLSTTLLAQTLEAARPEPGPGGARVIRVIDGDTIYASNYKTSVRLLGIDAPETRKNVRTGYRCEEELALGLRAKARLESLLAAPHKVVVKHNFGPDHKALFDEYGRRLAIVTSDGKDVGATLVAENLAKAWHPGEDRPNWCSLK